MRLMEKVDAEFDKEFVVTKETEEMMSHAKKFYRSGALTLAKIIIEDFIGGMEDENRSKS